MNALAFILLSSYFLHTVAHAPLLTHPSYEEPLAAGYNVADIIGGGYVIGIKSLFPHRSLVHHATSEVYRQSQL